MEISHFFLRNKWGKFFPRKSLIFSLFHWLMLEIFFLSLKIVVASANEVRGHHCFWLCLFVCLLARLYKNIWLISINSYQRCVFAQPAPDYILVNESSRSLKSQKACFLTITPEKMKQRGPIVVILRLTALATDDCLSMSKVKVTERSKTHFLPISLEGIDIEGKIQGPSHSQNHGYIYDPY